MKASIVRICVVVLVLVTSAAAKYGPPLPSMVDIGTLGGGFVDPNDINNKGQIVGMSANSTGSIHAFLWENGTMIDLGTAGGISSYATKINEPGQIVGYIDLSYYEQHAFFWEAGVMTDLGTLGGPSSYTTD